MTRVVSVIQAKASLISHNFLLLVLFRFLSAAAKFGPPLLIAFFFPSPLEAGGRTYSVKGSVYFIVS